MWEAIRGYLTFTRKERYGVLFLLVLISILFVLPFFFKPSPGDPDPAAYQRMKKQIEKFDSVYVREADRHDRYNQGNLKEPEGFSRHPISSHLSPMFYFDPNSTTPNDWQRLGLPDRLIQTISHYIEKGGRFRRAEDLKKLYGLNNSDYERLLPFVRIPKTGNELNTRSYVKPNYAIPAVKKTDSFLRKNFWTPGGGLAWGEKRLQETDINQADSAAWSQLPGIGGKLASRIVHFREKLGGFYQIEQVAETFGLPDSTFQKIKPILRLNNVTLNQLDLNIATKEALQSHPYIRWQMAKGIIDYRQQHGGFHAIDELLQLARMDPMQFEKVKPYLVVN